MKVHIGSYQGGGRREINLILKLQTFGIRYKIDFLEYCKLHATVSSCIQELHNHSLVLFMMSIIASFIHTFKIDLYPGG